MILVDPIVDYGEIARRRNLPGTLWCHMISDQGADVPELHEMAQKIGLRRAWFQGDHYDLTPSKRRLAILNGAKDATRSEVGMAWRNHKQKREREIPTL